MLSIIMSVLSFPHSKRDRKKRDKAERIRAAALTLLRERGFEATTTRDIAARAGIAAGTLFLYVPRKEDLLDFLFTGEIERVVAAAFASLPTGPGLVEILMHPFARLIDFYAADLPLARVLLREGVLP